jgi:phage baseplate assembly protein W
VTTALNIDTPYRVGADGRTATTDRADHIRDMLMLLLLTRPGERVMRPDFGTGLMQYVHAPNSPELAATVQLTVQAAIQYWLGDLIELSALEVSSVDAELRVEVSYRILATGDLRSDTFATSAA